MMNIRNKDLNLLIIFLVVAEELNLSKASKRLHLSQPALSHALTRLRSQFDDPLFSRAQRGLTATPRVVELIPEVRALLRLAENIYLSPNQATPAEAAGRFVLASTTYFESRIIGSVVGRLHKEAPRVVLETRSLNQGFPGKDLEMGEIDLAVAAYFSDIRGAFRERTVLKEPFVCVSSKKSKFFRAKRTPESYLDSRHMQIEVPPGHVAPVDIFLAQKKKSRLVALRVGNFFTPGEILKMTDLVLTCPESLARRYAKTAGLEVMSLPFQLPQLETKMVWHDRTHHSSLHVWMREMIAEAAAT